MVSNFAFLKESFPVLADFGELAEQYLYSDSNSCLMKLHLLAIMMASEFNPVSFVDFPSVPPELASVVQLIP